MGKKGVTFDAIETLERQHDSIDKLSSLVSKMNVKTDLEARVGVDDKLFSLATDPYSRDRNRNRGKL